MNRLCKRWLILVAFVILVSPIAACSRQDEPARVAEKFLRAAASNDLAALQETVDPDVADEVLGAILLQVGLQALVGGSSSEFVELKVRTIRNDGYEAAVRASGKVRTKALGTQLVTPFDVEVPLVRKGGQWYVTEGP